jgi:hypothetical protein
LRTKAEQVFLSRPPENGRFPERGGTIAEEVSTRARRLLIEACRWHRRRTNRTRPATPLRLRSVLAGLAENGDGRRSRRDPPPTMQSRPVWPSDVLAAPVRRRRYDEMLTMILAPSCTARAKVGGCRCVASRLKDGDPEG